MICKVFLPVLDYCGSVQLVTIGREKCTVASYSTVEHRYDMANEHGVMCAGSHFHRATINAGQ